MYRRGSTQKSLVIIPSLNRIHSFFLRMASQHQRMCCVGMCPPGSRSTIDDETREEKDAWKWVELSRYPPSPHSLYSLTCSWPPYSHGHKQPIWSGFRFAYCWSHYRWHIPLSLSLVLSHSLSLFPSLENAGRVPRQKELSSPCQQPCVWGRPVPWQQ